jgi:hypothetical protein
MVWGNLFWWALPNLFVPLVTIPIAMWIQWLFSRPTSFAAVVQDGQVCFYSIALLAAAWYDVSELRSIGVPLSFLEIWFLFIGAPALLAYGILASDHLGRKMVTPRRAAVTSVVVGLASIGLALYVHYMVIAHAKRAVP